MLTFIRKLIGCRSSDKLDRNLHESGYIDTEDTTINTGLNTVNWGDVAEDVADFMRIHGTVDNPGKRATFTEELKLYLKTRHSIRKDNSISYAFNEGKSFEPTNKSNE